MEKIFTLNRKRQRIVLLVEENKNPKGLVFVMHHLGGHKFSANIAAYAEAFWEKKFTVVRIDATNSFGESEGNFADATITNYFEDLEDVILWAKDQSWYQEPFWLCGHSLGGTSSALYAQKYPEKVRALAPIATVVSGRLSSEVDKYKNLEEMKARGWIEERNGIKLNYSHMEDRFKYDLLSGAKKLTMPVLMIVGEKDRGTPFKHQKMLYDLLPGKKELHVIKDAPHVFMEERHLGEIKNIFLDWIDKVLQNIK